MHNRGRTLPGQGPLGGSRSFAIPESVPAQPGGSLERLPSSADSGIESGPIANVGPSQVPVIETHGYNKIKGKPLTLVKLVTAIEEHLAQLDS